MMHIRMLDLFCGGGGAARGYHDAFTGAGHTVDITGIDKYPQPEYPYRFKQTDALDYLCRCGHRYDFIHTSPPCQRYSSITKTAGTQDAHPDLIATTRILLRFVGKPYVIENVPGAVRELRNPLMLCGTMFGLLVQRHRYFETWPFDVWFPPAMCNHHRKVVKHGRRPDRDVHFAAVTGHFSDVAFAREAMGIDWMCQRTLAEAIPPAYTRNLGRHVVAYLLHRHEALAQTETYLQAVDEREAV